MNGPYIMHIYPWSTTIPKQMAFLLIYQQKVNSSLTLCHNAYVIHLTSSHYLGILSSHIIPRKRMLGKVILLFIVPGGSHSWHDVSSSNPLPNVFISHVPYLNPRISGFSLYLPFLFSLKFFLTP
ncbi:unnamed protein product [Nyctereutes procyonoides]|uniref:(raccoon dog) hypothetical protein n=1 Tax=Nyctereutes procyonoides TaxID=34880 RepID=A0A811YKR2_NYCPR|nr:unnamed protein product [Nyctereutes procyonoides]